MCRMIACPLGLPGRVLIEPFLRMAEGRNALNEHNTAHGVWPHPHGWGAVYEDVGRLRAHRSVLACWDDPGLEALSDVRVFLLHARRASRGGVTLANTHPFEHEAHGGSWFFCHNGTVRDRLPTPSALTEEDSTDSAKLFGLLLPFVREGEVLEAFRAVYGGIRDFTSLNSFLLGPDALWAVGLSTENPDYYAMTLAETEAGPIVSSELLDEFAGNRTTISDGTVVRIDRRTGAIDAFAIHAK
jgi:predicted glutamine amidotransferase